MKKCKVCGKRFKLKNEKRYIYEKVPVGLNRLTEGSTFYECFDCPKCGCQQIVNIREGNEKLNNDAEEVVQDDENYA